MEKIYYDKDADLKYLEKKTAGIIGYGIQGRAQALNIRDSGIKVLIANRKDEYAEQAVKDGFEVNEISQLVKKSDVIMFLIPDQAQAEVYEKYVKGFIRPNSLLVFAHGYTLRYETVKPSADIDVGMLAPRMPGHHIRNYFLNGAGVPAFLDVVQDKSGEAREKLLSLAKATGFTRAGVLEVSYKVEADLDLFTEQFLVAAIVRVIHTGFKVLVDEHGYPPVAALMELYASGELAEVLKLASKMGIGKVFQKNASPTCQYGIASNFDTALSGDLNQTARKILKQIEDGSFSKELDKEGNAGYPAVNKLWQTVNSEKLTKAQEWINSNFKTGDVNFKSVS
ncbi:MAG: ketol-acid reductoisomerase [Candidatus Omnitrophota bacterium]